MQINERLNELNQIKTQMERKMNELNAEIQSEKNRLQAEETALMSKQNDTNAVVGERMLTIKQAADYMNVTRKACEHYIYSGKLVARRIGNIWRIPESALLRFAPQKKGDRLLTVNQVSDIMQICTKTCRKYMSNGTLPGFKIDGDWHVYESELYQFIANEHPVQSPHKDDSSDLSLTMPVDLEQTEAPTHEKILAFLKDILSNGNGSHAAR